MHRSGTSLIAGLIYKMGGDMGNDSDFIRPNKWNPNGYFENKKIVQLNNYLITGYLSRLVYLFPPNTKLINSRYKKKKHEAIAFENQFINKYVKDNRFCLTADIWPKKINSLIIVLRNPIDIALSLRKRNKLPLILGLRIWRYHILKLIKSKNKDRRIYIFYENIIDLEKRDLELRKLINFTNHYCNQNFDISAAKNILKSEFLNIKRNNNLVNNYSNFKPYKKYTSLWKIIKRKYE